MKELNYIVLYPDGKEDVLHIGDADDDEIFLTMLSVFETPLGGFFDNYRTRTLYTFTANDVSIIANADDSGDGVKEFVSALHGKGFEIYTCWHENHVVFQREGVHGENRFLCGENRERIFGPVVIRSRVDQEDAVEVPASNAMAVATMILKSNGQALEQKF